VRAFNGDDPAANRDLLTFMGASYFQGHEPTDPLVSPLFGDFTACRRCSSRPRRARCAERHDTAGGARREGRRRRDAAGGRGFRPCLHDFPFLPETRATMEEVANWAQRNLRRNDMRPQAAE